MLKIILNSHYLDHSSRTERAVKWQDMEFLWQDLTEPFPLLNCNKIRILVRGIKSFDRMGGGGVARRLVEQVSKYETLSKV